MKRILVLFLCVGFVGCATLQPAKNFDQIILNDVDYTYDRGRSLAQKYRPNLERIVSEIRQHYTHTQLEFLDPLEGKKSIGVYFGYDLDDPTKKSALTINMYSTTQYNTLQTDYGQRAATVFLQLGRTLFNVAYSDKEIMSDEDVYGISLCLRWVAKDFVKEEYFGGKVEGICIYADKSVCGDFVENRITNQEFMQRSKVSGYQGGVFLGLIEVDLGKAL